MYTIQGATTATYDPPSITNTKQYRRVSKRLGCNNDWKASNTVTYTITSSFVMQPEHRINGTGSWNPGISSVEICEGQQLELGANPNGLTSLQWSGPNGFNGTGDGILLSNSVTPAMSGDYIVIGTDAGGCAATTTIKVTVIPSPQATFTKTDAFCGNNNGTITLTFSDEADQTFIEFSLNGGNTYQPAVTDNSVTVTYNNLSSGTYTIYARWGDGICPVNLGSITITNQSSPSICNPNILFNKEINADTVLIGQTIFYTFTINNSTGTVLNNVQFSDNLSNNSLFFSDPLETTNGIQVTGTAINLSYANLTLNNVPLGISSFKLAVDVPSTLNQGDQFCNQARLSNLAAANASLPNTLFSDNPLTPTVGDHTCVIVKKYENCCNGIDDDGDGLCDSDDPDCGN